MSAAAVAAPVVPAYSLETLPVFFHSANSSGPWSEESIHTIAKYPLVTMEKFQGTCWARKNATGCDQVAIMEEQLRRVKAINPSVATIIYFNAVIDFPQYTIHEKMLADPSWRLHTSSGETVTIRGDHITDAWVFDYLNEETAAAVAAQCIDAVRAGMADGCFFDRANQTSVKLPNATHYDLWHAAEQATLAKVQSTIAPGLLIANHGYTEAGTSAAMVEQCDNSAEALSWLNASIAAGKTVECHVGLDLRGSCSPGDENRDSVLAMFLTVVPPSTSKARAYFGCGPWLMPGADLGGYGWQADYDKPLGEPLGPATLGTDNVLRRTFKSGTTTEYNVVTNRGTVHWASN